MNAGPRKGQIRHQRPPASEGVLRRLDHVRLAGQDVVERVDEGRAVVRPRAHVTGSTRRPIARRPPALPSDLRAVAPPVRTAAPTASPRAVAPLAHAAKEFDACARERRSGSRPMGGMDRDGGRIRRKPIQTMAIAFARMRCELAAIQPLHLRSGLAEALAHVNRAPAFTTTRQSGRRGTADQGPVAQAALTIRYAS
jgi:hypothetical protein